MSTFRLLCPIEPTDRVVHIWQKALKCSRPYHRSTPVLSHKLELYRLTVYLQEICRERLLYMMDLRLRLYRCILFHVLARLLWGCIINDLIYSQLHYIGMLMVSRL